MKELEEAPEGPDAEEKMEGTRTSGTVHQWGERVETKDSMGRTVVDPVVVVKTPLSGCQTSGGREEDAEGAQMTECCEMLAPLLALWMLQRRKTLMGVDKDVEKQEPSSRPIAEDRKEEK